MDYDADVHDDLELGGRPREGGVNDSLGHGHEVSCSYDHYIPYDMFKCTRCISRIPLNFSILYAPQDEDTNKTVKTLGAGPLRPVRGFVGILKSTSMLFTKTLMKSKNLVALQPSPTTTDDRIVLPPFDAGEDDGCKVEVGPALDGNVDTLLTVKVRGTPFVAPLFSVGLGPSLSLCITLTNRRCLVPPSAIGSKLAQQTIKVTKN